MDSAQVRSRRHAVGAPILIGYSGPIRISRIGGDQIVMMVPRYSYTAFLPSSIPLVPVYSAETRSIRKNQMPSLQLYSITVDCFTIGRYEASLSLGRHPPLHSAKGLRFKYGQRISVRFYTRITSALPYPSLQHTLHNGRMSVLSLE